MEKQNEIVEKKALPAALSADTTPSSFFAVDR